MAIYHLSVKPVSRSSGRSATAAAAYRAGERIECAREGRVHDYSRKQGVEHSEIIVPSEASWAQDRSALWNAAEAAEKRINSTVAREYELALPSELSAQGRIDLARDFGRELLDRYGVGVDIAIHAPHRDGDQRNWHAHVLTTTRRIESEGFGAKTRILDDQKTGPVQVKELRAVWGELSNRYLEREMRHERVDHRSLEAIRDAHREEGLSHREAGCEEQARESFLAMNVADRPAQVHMGPAATAMERRAEREAREEGRDYEPVTRVGAEVFRAREFRETFQDYVRDFVELARARVAYLSERVEQLGTRLEAAYEHVKERLQERLQEHGFLRSREGESAREGERESLRGQDNQPIAPRSFLERRERSEGRDEIAPQARAPAPDVSQQGSFLERREQAAAQERDRAGALREPAAPSFLERRREAGHSQPERAQEAPGLDVGGAAHPSELSPEREARETQRGAAPDPEKLRAYGEAAKAAFARSREVAGEGAERGAGERQQERAQMSAAGEAQEREPQQTPRFLDAERKQAIAQEAKLAFYKAEGAAKAREAFAQAEERRAQEAERERIEVEREQQIEREALRQRSHDHGYER